ncbi:MAG TPA: hypothetical protein PK156_13790 [Polyangium sp.]|nr:hypothetical protein [Polyangium sp.]
MGTETPRRRYLLSPPGETRPSLIVELCPQVNETVLQEVRDVMFGRGCANGLVVDDEQCVILRDSFMSMDATSIEEDPNKLETHRLLGDSPDSLEYRLERWMNALVTNWHEAVPPEPWAAPLIMDVVPAASGSLVRRAMVGGRW